MTNEEAIGTLLMLYDAVDDEGVIDTHTWYKGIQNDIMESLSLAINSLKQQNEKSCRECQVFDEYYCKYPTLDCDQCPVKSGHVF